MEKYLILTISCFVTSTWRINKWKLLFFREVFAPDWRVSLFLGVTAAPAPPPEFIAIYVSIAH